MYIIASNVAFYSTKTIFGLPLYFGFNNNPVNR